MLFQLRIVFFMMLIGLIVADEHDWYQMETKYGLITMDHGGWAKPVDPQYKATLFKDMKYDNHMYIMVMSGRYKGYFLGGDYNKGIGAWTNWHDAGYMTWNDCILTSKSGFTKDLPITYGPNGFFYFYAAGGNYPSVCVKKVYTDDHSKSSLKDVPSKSSLKDVPSKSSLKVDHSNSSLKDDHSKSSLKIIVKYGSRK